MLFMKGTPDGPRCGFSRTIVEILRRNDVAFDSFDVLADEEVGSFCSSCSLALFFFLFVVLPFVLVFDSFICVDSIVFARFGIGCW